MDNIYIMGNNLYKKLDIRFDQGFISDMIEISSSRIDKRLFDIYHENYFDIRLKEIGYLSDFTRYSSIRLKDLFIRCMPPGSEVPKRMWDDLVGKNFSVLFLPLALSDRDYTGKLFFYEDQPIPPVDLMHAHPLLVNAYSVLHNVINDTDSWSACLIMIYAAKYNLMFDLVDQPPILDGLGMLTV